MEFEYKDGSIVDRKIEVKKSGYLRLEGRGSVEGKDSDVFIASPMFVKE